MAVSLRWLVPLLAAVVVLGGCDGGSGAADPVHSYATPVGQGCGQSYDEVSCGADDRDGGPVTLRGASKGGTVTVLTHSGLHGTLVPSEVHQPDLLSIDRGLITRSLTQYGYDPRTKQTTLMPDLATNLGLHNDDYTVWEFVIRPGVRFENGERVSAADVVRGVRRCLHATTSPTGPCQQAARTYVRSVQAIRHGRVIRFRLRKPFPDLPSFAAFPGAGPVPAGRQATDPLATGPYQIAGYRPGHELVLTRNPEWDPVTDPVRTQYPDGYVFRAGVPTRTIEHSMLSDTDPTALTYDHLSRHTLMMLKVSAPDRMVLGGQPCTTYVAPDNRTVTDVRVRRALALAYPSYDVVRINGAIGHVTAVPATNLVPPQTPGRTAYPTHGRRGFASRPDAAHALLRSAHALGTEIRFAFDPAVPASVRTMHAIVRALDGVGFRTRPVPVGRALLTHQANAPVDLRTTTRCGDWPAESAWVPALFGSTHPDRTGSLGKNLAAFSRPSVDRELARIRRRPLEQQAAAYNRLEHLVLDRWAPEFAVSYGGVDMSHGSRVNGMSDDTTLGMPTWQQVWVAR